MLNLELLFITVYTIVDDIYKEMLAPPLGIAMDLNLTLAIVE